MKRAKRNYTEFDTVVDLSHCVGVSDDLGTIARVCTDLSQLDLSGSDVTNDDLSRLKDLPVEILFLCECAHLTDGCLGHLVNCKGLHFLRLQMVAGITDAGIEALAQIGSLRTVELLATSVTPDGVARLQALRPDVEVWP